MAGPLAELAEVVGMVLVAWLIVRRIFGRRVGRLFLSIWPLAAVVVADYVLSPFLWLMPKTILPPLHPAMTWAGVVAYLSRPVGSSIEAGALDAHIFGARPEPGFLLTQVPFVVAAAVVLLLALRGRRGLRPAAEATHGSSRWRRPAERAETMQRVSCSSPEAAGGVVGADGRSAHVTRPDVGNPHILLLGATRAGKSRRVILPTVWTLGHRGESMVLTDPKGELYGHAAEWLRARGYQVVLLDLLRPSRGNRWNPLAAVLRAVEAGDTGEASRLAWEIGNTLAFGDQTGAGSGADPLWAQAAEATIAALALGTALEAPEGARHPATMYRLLSELGGDGKGGKTLDEWFRGLASDHPARLAYGTTALSESRTRSSIFTGTAANLRTFADPGVAWATAASDHDPAEAGRKPTAIFLLLPDEAGARRPIASLYVAQAYSSLAAVARDAGGRLPVPVWFLLDEFGNVGRLPGIAEKLTVSAGRGIRFLLAVQSVAQIDHVYGPKVREIVAGNCDTTLFLRAADMDTAKMISDKAGQYTVRTTSVQRRPGLGFSAGGGTDSATGRALLTSDEVLRWPLGESLILQAGQYPARLPLADLSAWRDASRAFVPHPLGAAAPLTPVETWCPPPPPVEGDDVEYAGQMGVEAGTNRRGEVFPPGAEEAGEDPDEDEAAAAPQPVLRSPSRKRW